MALAELLLSLERDAEAEIRALATAAAAEVARIDAGAERERAERRAAVHGAIAADHRAASDRELVAASRRVRAELLEGRAAMLERVRAALHAALPGIVDDRAASLGPALVAAALAGAGGRAGVLSCAPGLAAAARAVAPPELRVEVDPRIATGAVIELTNGTRVDATLEVVLAREWPRLASEAVAIVEERVA